jgi:hypothetical protein
MRAIILLAAGATLGAAATAVWLIDQGGSATDADESSSAQRPDDTGRESARADAGPIAVHDRLSWYRDAAVSDIETLQAALRRAASAAPSRARDLEIDAALVQLAEIDPALAARDALALRLDDRFVTIAFEVWAAIDANAALEAVAAIGDTNRRRLAALGLLGVVDVDRAAAVLPEPDRVWLRISDLTTRAEYDPAGAFSAALSLSDEGARRAALSGIATAWVRQDPASAMARTASLSDPLRTQIQQALASEWGRFDAAGFLAYVETTPNPEVFVYSVQSLLGADPEVLLRIAARMSGTAARSIRSSAVFMLAQRDPAAAIAIADSMPPGEDRNRALQQIASAYAREDPAAALQWVRSLQPPSREAQLSALSSVASQDPLLALELLDQDAAAGIDRDMMWSMVSSSVAREHPEMLPQFAEKLLSRGDLAATNALGNLLMRWTSEDPDAALDWVLSRRQGLDPSILSTVGRQLATRDPQTAASYVDRLPLSLRDEWIASIAAPYARYDPEGALTWIARYQGQPGYEQAFRQVVQQSAQADPRAAAAMLSQASPDVVRGAAAAVTSSWSRQDPRAAAQWAEDLSDPRARAAARRGAVSGWATSDVDGAERWALTLPEGDERDATLAVIVQRRAAAGDFDRAMLDRFSSDVARQTAVAGSLAVIAQRDVEEARSLLDEYIDDPTLRERAEAMIELGQNNRSLALPVF